MCVSQLKRMSHTEYVALVFGAAAEAKSREVERARREAREREHRRLTGGALLRHLLQRSVSAKRHEISGRLLTTGSPTTALCTSLSSLLHSSAPCALFPVHCSLFTSTMFTSTVFCSEALMYCICSRGRCAGLSASSGMEPWDGQVLVPAAELTLVHPRSSPLPPIGRRALEPLLEEHSASAPASQRHSRAFLEDID